VWQFAAYDAALLAGAAAGNDFDATELIGMRGQQETLEGLEG
jgi:hypothetical protein